MPIVTAAEIEDLMVTGIKAAALTQLIGREESWLATDPLVGIGALTGERTIALRPRDLTRDLRLNRPPDPATLVVTDNGVELADAAIAVLEPTIIRKLAGPWTGPVVEVKLTPTDAPAVKSAVIELVRLAVTASPYRQESTEGHSYTKPAELAAMRQDIARSLNPNRAGQTIYIGTPAGATG